MPPPSPVSKYPGESPQATGQSPAPMPANPASDGHQPHLLQLQEHLMRAMVNLDILCIEAQLRILRYVVRI